jgi:hypothetical protein
VANGEDVNRTFTERTSESVYAATLVNISEATTNGDYFFMFRNTDGGLFARVYVMDDGAGNLVFGLKEQSTGGGSTLYSTTGTVWSKNTTYLIVVKYDFTTGAASLYVSSTVPSTEPTSPEVTIGDADNATKLSAVAFRQGSNTPNFTADGVRAATDWAGFIGL